MLIEEWKDRPKDADHKQQKLLNRLQRKKGKKLDQLADQLHEDVFSEIDCLDCANCCTSIPPIVNRGDINRAAKYLGMRSSDFEQQYIRIDEDGDQVINGSPCPFLEEDNKCQIYDARPRACREYPHTDGQEFSQNMKLHAFNTRFCPAVFHILQRMEEKLEG